MPISTMGSPAKSSPMKESPPFVQQPGVVEDTQAQEHNSDAAQSYGTIPKTPQPEDAQPNILASSPNSPDVPSPYDWEDFERRYEEALRAADEEEKEILKEAESLSRYFRSWASAASIHDDERAVKRLQTRKRFVNLSEEKMAQKQQHYEEVVKAFESALALLRAT